MIGRWQIPGVTRRNVREEPGRCTWKADLPRALSGERVGASYSLPVCTPALPAFRFAGWIRCSPAETGLSNTARATHLPDVSQARLLPFFGQSRGAPAALSAQNWKILPN